MLQHNLVKVPVSDYIPPHSTASDKPWGACYAIIRISRLRGHFRGCDATICSWVAKRYFLDQTIGNRWTSSIIVWTRYRVTSEGLWWAFNTMAHQTCQTHVSLWAASRCENGFAVIIHSKNIRSMAKENMKNKSASVCVICCGCNNRKGSVETIDQLTCDDC